MLPSPFSQGCYGDVSFFLYTGSFFQCFFFFPFLLVFLLSFVSDWLLFYAEDAAIVFPRKAEVVQLPCVFIGLSLSLKEPEGGCGWA